MFIRTSFSNSENNDTEFKSVFRKFYQLNAAKLSGEFCESYFSLLEECREKNDNNIVEIIDRLYEIESNKKGTHAVHFSFSTKLAHTLDNTLPIYDSLVAAFYFFPERFYILQKKSSFFQLQIKILVYKTNLTITTGLN